jgi:hypothetical protein
MQLHRVTNLDGAGKVEMCEAHATSKKKSLIYRER